MRRIVLALLLVAATRPAAGGNATSPALRRLLARGSSASDDSERLPGWQGEQSRRRRRASKGEEYAREDRERGTWMELISWRPRAYVIHNFMSPEECVALVKTARPFMARSTVVDSVTGESKVDPIRTRCVRLAAPRAAAWCAETPRARLARHQRADVFAARPVPAGDKSGGACGADALLRHWRCLTRTALRAVHSNGWRA